MAPIQKVELKDWDILLGYYIFSTHTVILTYEGEYQYFKFLCERNWCLEKKEITLDEFLSISQDTTGSRLFLEKYFTFKKKFTRKTPIIKGRTKKLVSLENINYFLWGVFTTSLSRTVGEKTIEVYDSEWNKCPNTHFRNAERLIKKGSAKKINTNKIQLTHVFRKRVEYKEWLRDELYRIQKEKCNKCNCKLSRDVLELHHRIIPQILTTINSLWNCELLCHNCHREKHELWSISSFVIFLILNFRKWRS